MSPGTLLIYGEAQEAMSSLKMAASLERVKLAAVGGVVWEDQELIDEGFPIEKVRL